MSLSEHHADMVAGPEASYRVYSGLPTQAILLGESFDPGDGFNSYPLAFFIQPAGKIIAVGGYATYNGTARNRVNRQVTPALHFRRLTLELFE